MLGILILLGTALVLVVLVLSGLVAWEAMHPQRRTTAYALARGLPTDPGDAGLKFQEWSLDLSDGSELCVWEVEGRMHPSGGPCHTHTQPTEHPPRTVVFIHGWGQSKIDTFIRRSPYDEFATRLLFYDLRGHGESTGSVSRVGSREEDDLLELLRRIGGGDVLLVGHSLGSVIALLAAARTDELSGVHIRGVVAYGPYTSSLIPIGNRLRTMRLPALFITELAMVWMRLCGIHDVSVARAACSLSTPVLIIHGREDRISPEHDIARLAEMIPGARVRTLKGVGHSDAHEKTPHDHAAMVREFLEEQMDAEPASSIA